MKISKQRLKEIIREELSTLNEVGDFDVGAPGQETGVLQWLSRVDPEKLEASGGWVDDPVSWGAKPMTYNSNNGVIAVVDENMRHYFLRPRPDASGRYKFEAAWDFLESPDSGYTRSENVPVPAWHASGLSAADIMK